MSELGDSPYAVLEVARSADAAAIEAAYRRLDGLLAEGALASYGMLDGADVGQLRHQLELAYAILSDPGRRATFDRTGDPLAAAAQAVTPARPQAPCKAKKSAAPGAFGPSTLALPADPAPSFAASLPAEPARAATPGGVPVHRPRVPGRPALQVPLLAELPEAARFDGKLLKALRESAQVSIDELSEWTKIGRRYLIALENEDFGLLPAKVYVRGFVGEVARILGVDAGRVARSYLEGYDAWSARG